MVNDLYQETVIDHSKRPRNYRVMADANRQAEGYNPLCGDKLKLYLKMDGETVKEASFVGAGCAISTASASLMTESLKGKSREEALKLLDKFHEMLTTDAATQAGMGKLVVFCGVRDYPARVKCATLAWHTLKTALETTGDPAQAKVATTE